MRLDEAKITIEITLICLNSTDLARRGGLDEYGVYETEYSVNVNSALPSGSASRQKKR